MAPRFLHLFEQLKRTTTLPHHLQRSLAGVTGSLLHALGARRIVLGNTP